MKPEAIIERLVADGALDDARRKSGEEIAEGAGLPLVRVLLHMKLVESAAVASAIAAVSKRQVLSLDKWLQPSPLPQFSEGLCRELRVFPLAFEAGDDGGQRLVLAMSDPSDADAGVKVAALVGNDVRSVLVDDAALTRAIARRYAAAEPMTELVLIDALSISSLDIDVADVTAGVDSEDDVEPTTEGPPLEERSDGDVFAASDFSEDAPTSSMPMRTPFVRDTVLAVSPFLEPGSDATDVGSAFGKLKVVVVTFEADTRLRVAADLAPLVKEAHVVDDLAKAAKVAAGADEVVVHNPKNDAATGMLLDRVARAARRPLVVISDDDSFDELPCIRKRIPLPALGARALAPAILEALFDR